MHTRIKPVDSKLTIEDIEKALKLLVDKIGFVPKIKVNEDKMNIELHKEQINITFTLKDIKEW